MREKLLNLIREMAIIMDANTRALEAVNLMLETAKQETVTLKKK